MRALTRRVRPVTRPTGLTIAPGSYSKAKAGGYYSNTRDDLVTMLPRPLGRVLDVGCGEGSTGELLLQQGATTVTGIEINADAAQRAGEILDDVRVGPVEDVLLELDGPWNTICCHDVLEHLIDPSAVLKALRARAAPGGHLQVSIPNARHVSLLIDLVFRSTFGYTEWGHRDSTHLRWFTRRDIEAVIAAAGWRVLATSHPALHRSYRLDRLTRGHSTEFLVGQWYVLAVAAS